MRIDGDKTANNDPPEAWRISPVHALSGAGEWDRDLRRHRLRLHLQRQLSALQRRLHEHLQSRRVRPQLRGLHLTSDPLQRDAMLRHRRAGLSVSAPDS